MAMEIEACVPQTKRPRRTIRSFVRRGGRMTAPQEQQFECHFSLYGIKLVDGTPLDFKALFGREADTIIEIGFGDGQSLFEMAQKMPEKNFIGIEVYRFGLYRLLTKCFQAGLQNIKVICSDATEVLEHKVAEGELAGLQLFFPDPWPKTRHHKRRLITPAFVELAAKKLRVGGVFHLATDWQDYAEQMLSVLGAAPQLQNMATNSQFIVRPPHRPITKYEERAHKLGHSIWDLIFKRVAYN